MMTPKLKFDQALMASIGENYANLLSFSIDTNGVTQLQLHADLLKDTVMLEKFLETLHAGVPTHSLQVSFESHPDVNVEESLTALQEMLKDVKEMQITQVSSQGNDQEKGSPLKSYASPVLIGVGILAAPFIVPAFLGAVGFTAAGITAHSAAAGLMSLYGGAIAKGSLCAILQSTSVIGLGPSGIAVSSTVGALIGGIVSKLF